MERRMDDLPDLILGLSDCIFKTSSRRNKTLESWDIGL